MELKSLSQWSECAGAESGCFRILRECLVFFSMCLGVPFIAPRQLGAVGDQLGRPILPSVEWVHHRTATVHVRCLISFHTESRRPLVLGIGWRTGQSGVPNRPLARPRVVRRLRGRPLALATIGSPDSPVNFSRTPFSFSRGRRVHRGWLIGQFDAPPDSPVNFSRTTPSIPESGHFTVD
jgi:hypothetical protein